MTYSPVASDRRIFWAAQHIMQIIELLLRWNSHNMKLAILQWRIQWYLVHSQYCVTSIYAKFYNIFIAPLRNPILDFLSDTVDRNLPSNAGNTLVWEDHMVMLSNSAHEPQLLKPMLLEPVLHNKSMCVLSHFSHVWRFATLWTVICQIPLFMGFSRQENWSGLPFPTLGNFPNPGIEPMHLMSPASAGRFFTTSAKEKPLQWEAHALPQRVAPACCD